MSAQGPKRWVVLGAFCAITAVLQMQWLTFAPVARHAREIYGVDSLAIDGLSLVFMLVFLLGSIPASSLIEARGVRFAVCLGAAVTAAFGLLKSAAAGSYSVVLLCQIAIAAAQPLILNATTKLAREWFPVAERGLAVGLATLSQFVGIVAVMLVTPSMMEGSPEPAATLQLTLLVYAAIAIVTCGLVFAFVRDGATGSAEGAVSGWQAVRRVFLQRDLRLTLAMFFLGLGMFNAISTCIDAIGEQKGLSVEQSGLVGGAMLIAGIVGGVVLPLLSDRARRRKPFLVACMALTVVGVAGFAWVTDYVLLLLSACVLGAFLLGGGAPIGFQYAAEVSHPIPETVAQGVILMSGQVSGIAFIVGMNVIGMLPSLWIHLGFAIAILILTLQLGESPLILIDGRVQTAGDDG